MTVDWKYTTLIQTTNGEPQVPPIVGSASQEIDVAEPIENDPMAAPLVEVSLLDSNSGVEPPCLMEDVMEGLPIIDLEDVSPATSDGATSTTAPTEAPCGTEVVHPGSDPPDVNSSCPFEDLLQAIHLATKSATSTETRQRSTAAKQAINQLARLPVEPITAAHLAPIIKRLFSNECHRGDWCKRQGIRLLPLTAVDPATTTMAVKAIVAQLATPDGNRKIISAARGALTRIVERQGTPALVQIAVCAQLQAGEAYVYDAPLKRTLNEWISKANSSLRSLPIDPVNWQSVLSSMATEATDAAPTTRDTTCWTDASDAARPIGNSKIIAWNVNGFRRCMKSGKFKEFIINNDPDVLFLTETKCSLSSIPRPGELKHALHTLGYKHVHWNACTIKGRTGNWGCALISKIKPTSVRVGMGDDNIDEEGRTITARFMDVTVIGTYSPCSRPGVLEHPARTAYDKALRAHHVTEGASKMIIGIGDYNLAPTPRDSTLRRHEQALCPSSKVEERKAYEELLTEAGLCDAFAHLAQPYAPPEFSWQSPSGSMLYGRDWRMRIDLCLAQPARTGPGVPDGLPRIASVEILPGTYSSDHNPLVVQLNDKGTPDHTASEDTPMSSVGTRSAPCRAETGNNKDAFPMLARMMDVLPTLPDISQELLQAILILSAEAEDAVGSLLCRATDDREQGHPETSPGQTPMRASEAMPPPMAAPAGKPAPEPPPMAAPAGKPAPEPPPTAPQTGRPAPEPPPVAAPAR